MLLIKAHNIAAREIGRLQLHFLFLGRLKLPLITLFSLNYRVYIYAWHTLLSLAAASLAKCQPLLAFLFRNSHIPNLFQFFWQFFSYVSFGVPLVVQDERHLRHLSLP